MVSKKKKEKTDGKLQNQKVKFSLLVTKKKIHNKMDFCENLSIKLACWTWSGGQAWRPISIAVERLQQTSWIGSAADHPGG